MNTDSLTRLRQGLHQHFGRGAAAFVDPVLWLLAGQVAVDLPRLDAWLQESNPDYAAGESMRDFIRRRFGDKAEQFIAHWIDGEPK